MSTDAVVIGVGNPWRGDDGAGIAVARLLDGRLPAGTRILERRGEATELIDAWDGAGTALVIDAARSGAPPGTVHRLDSAAGAIAAPAPATSTHGLSLAQALELSRALDRLPRRLIVYGIEVADTEHGDVLTDAVARAVSEVADRIVAEVAA